jgi:diguanylate cyclase (GGDEF)-like protein
MIYQRHIPREELFAAQLELLMQNARLATISAHLAGVVATVALFWAFLEWHVMIAWASGFTIVLLLRALQMSNALVERRFQTHPGRVYWQLIVGALVTGAMWSMAFVFIAPLVPDTMQHVFLVLIITITAFSVGVTVVIREYFIAHLFSSLWPIAWWSLAHYWQQPYNLLIGLFLLLICAVMISVSDRMYTSYRNMIALNWERESMSRELGELTGSLRNRNSQLRDARRQLTDLANVDELTGLGNRRVVNTALRAEINRARRNGSPLSVIMLDVDYFKKYNDTYGHPAGDEVLQQLADLMQRATSRAGEVVARYGGEEFILVLPGAGKEEALRTAQRLKDLVLQEAIPHKASDEFGVITVSQGVITATPEGECDPQDIIQLADDALYRAKKSGRNAIDVA